MEPTLHHWYTADEATAAFGGTGDAELLCDGQFVVLPKAVLCMATVGEPKRESHFCSPSCFVWRPGRLSYAPSDEIVWFPAKARKVWGADRKKVKEHHVFVRQPVDERFFYAGEAHLGAFGNERGQVGASKVAYFSLKDKLPPDAWLRLGSYSGWLVEVNHETHRVEKGNLAAFERLVAQLLRQEFSHLCMTRYEQDSLTLHTNARRGWLMYLRYPGDSGMYPRDREYDGCPDTKEKFECLCGIDLQFPVHQTLPRRLALEAALDFFLTGELPPQANWRAV